MKIAQSEDYQGGDWWKWSVWLEAPDEDLDGVEKVVWQLHPTFPEPIQERTDRTSKFRLDTSGWGTFLVQAEVHKKDGKKIKLKHELVLYYPEDE